MQNFIEIGQQMFELYGKKGIPKLYKYIWYPYIDMLQDSNLANNLAAKH